MSDYKGDFSPGDTVRFTFNSNAADGTLAALGGSPALAAYINLGTTEITTGITLTASLDGRAGLNAVAVATAADPAVYLFGTEVELVLTAGTVGGVSVVGYSVGHFSLARAALMRGIIDMGIAVATSANGLTIRAPAIFPDNDLVGATVIALGSTQGYPQERYVLSNVGDVLTVDAWTVQPTGTVPYILFGTPPATSLGAVATAAELALVKVKTDMIGTNGSGLTSILTALALKSSQVSLDSAIASVGVVQTKTDQLAFTGGNINAVVKVVNGQTVAGTGTTLDPWRPV